MQDSVKEFIAICADNLPLKDPIYEIGSLQVEGQEEYADLRPIFAGRKYIGVDMRNGKGVDIVRDLTLQPLDSPAGTIICCDTLEHVHSPFKFVENIHTSILYGGFILVTVPFNFPIHNYPFDYYRYTPEGLRYLFIQSMGVVISVGSKDMPKEVFGIFMKGSKSLEMSPRLRGELKEFIKKYSHVSLMQKVRSTITSLSQYNKQKGEMYEIW